MYKGRYRGNVVAVKEYVAVSRAEHTREAADGVHEEYEKDDRDKQDDAMFLFRYVFTVYIIGGKRYGGRHVI